MKLAILLAAFFVLFAPARAEAQSCQTSDWRTCLFCTTNTECDTLASSITASGYLPYARVCTTTDACRDAVYAIRYQQQHNPNGAGGDRYICGWSANVSNPGPFCGPPGTAETAMRSQTPLDTATSLRLSRRSSCITFALNLQYTVSLTLVDCTLLLLLFP